MKTYLVFNCSTLPVQFFEVDEIPIANAKMHQLSWEQGYCVLCKLIGPLYVPVAKVEKVYIYVKPFMAEIEKYIALYHLALNNLPKGFPVNYKFE